MNSQKINKNTTLQKNERETLIKKWHSNICTMDSEQVYVLTKGRQEKNAGAKIKIAKNQISLGGIPYYPCLPN